ncbi:hypothetical protein [Mumia sp. Pv 4-285]|uniref:hypothetical protein n=1 Tax=Mumia qirimensis TaxID=3234852 RepID=UPI00351D4D59
MKKLIRTAAIAASAIALVGGAAGTAHANAPWDVKVGGGYGSGAATFASTGALSFTVPLLPMSCTSSNGSGAVTTGAAVNNPVAAITSIGFTGCTGPGGLPMGVTKGAGNWNLNLANDPNGPTVWTGTITGINARVTDQVGGTTCDFQVTGSVAASFSETTQVLSINNSTGLTVTLLNGTTCLGLVANGDPATFDGDYLVTTAGGAVNIT